MITLRDTVTEVLAAYFDDGLFLVHEDEERSFADLVDDLVRVLEDWL